MILRRVCYREDCTFGVLLMDNRPIMVTLEDPWINNEKFKSCIPNGKYTVIGHNSSKYPNTWEVTHVPDRDAILIHVGNTAKDTNGCILVGRRFGMLGGVPAIFDSRHALYDLRELTGNMGSWELTIEHGGWGN